MGAETQNQQLAGNSEARARLAEQLRQRRAGGPAIDTAKEGRERRVRAIEGATEEGQGVPESIAEAIAANRARIGAPEVGQASMFPGEAPGQTDVPKPPGYEEASYRRGELTRERDRTGRREEIFRKFQEAAAQRGEDGKIAPGGAVERGASLFGAPLGGAGTGPRSGIAFGPGRANRMPDAGTPEYQQLVERMRSFGRR